MSYAKVARENHHLWDVNEKKIGVIRELVKNSKLVRHAIQLYFFGKLKRYAKRRYLKQGFLAFKKYWDRSTSYRRLEKIFKRRDGGYGSEDDVAYERERIWIPKCFGNHALGEDCCHHRTSQSFYYEGPKCAHIIACRIQKIWRRYKAYKLRKEHEVKWYAMRPEYRCYKIARDILVPILTEDVYSVIESFINFKEWKEDWLRRYYNWNWGLWNPNNRQNFYNRTIWLKKSTDPSDSIWFPNQKECISAKSIIRGRGGAYVLVAKQLPYGLQIEAYVVIQHCTSTIFRGKMVHKMQLSQQSGDCCPFGGPYMWKKEDQGIYTMDHCAEFGKIDLGEKVVIKLGSLEDREREDFPFLHYYQIQWNRLKTERGIYPRIANQVKLGAKTYFTDTGLYCSHN